jgi:SH3-like domain-containing protein
MRSLAVIVFILGFFYGPIIANAIEFRSVTDEITVLYEAPSTQSRKQLILTRGYPVEVIIETEGWVRVRDDAGTFGWIESARLDTNRTVMVSRGVAQARREPSDSAEIVFRASKGVLLDFLDVAGGWAKVRHRSGMVAYVRLTDLWGV